MTEMFLYLSVVDPQPLFLLPLLVLRPSIVVVIVVLDPSLQLLLLPDEALGPAREISNK